MPDIADLLNLLAPQQWMSLIWWQLHREYHVSKTCRWTGYSKHVLETRFRDSAIRGFREGKLILFCIYLRALSISIGKTTDSLIEITSAPWYVTNHTLHKDLRIPQVRTVLQELTDTHRTALQSHPNPLTAQILAPPNSRQLLRKWTLDVIT